MSARLPTGLLVTALLRRVNDAGGMAMVRASGDPQAGAMLFVVDDAGTARILERGVGPDGGTALIESKPSAADDGSADAYWRRRRARDPDLWVVELSGRDVATALAETLGLV